MERSTLEASRPAPAAWAGDPDHRLKTSRWRLADEPVEPDQQPALCAVDTNAVLAFAPPSTLAAWQGLMERLELVRGDWLHESGAPVRHVYFPIEAVVSLQQPTRDGGSCEIAMVGAEGVVGIGAFMGDDRSAHRAVVQRAGAAVRVPAHAVRAAFAAQPALRQMMLRCAQAQFAQAAQTAVCNRHHPVPQQLCRWLLFSLDRTHGRQLAVTQEQIALLLGVRRESISEEIGRLRLQGVVSTSRGYITVLDRAWLELSACECYAAVRRQSDRLRPRHLAT